MGKKAALAAIGTGAAAASASSAAYALNNSSGEEYMNSERGETLSTTSGINTTITTAGNIGNTNELSNWLNSNSSDSSNKERYFGSNMAFGNATFGSTTNETSIDSAGSNYFGDLTKEYKTGDYAKIKSNLEITVKRQVCSNTNQWWGELTWFWSFENKKTNKGFITFNKATTNKEKNALLLTGVFYMLEKSGDNWDVKYKKEVKETDNKYLDGANFKKYFPKPFWYTKRGRFDEMYYTNWDFIKNVDELKNLCDKPDPEPTSIRTGTWEYKSDRWWEKHWGWWGFEWYNHVYHWAGDHNDSGGVQWFEFMYGKDKFKLEESLDSFFLGTWYPKKWFRSN